MYYNPANGQILDFNEAYPDFKKKVIRSLIPLSYSFSEDPVRMLRAIKYEASTGFALKWNIKRAIKRNASNIADCSTSRLTEEVVKILSSGYAAPIFKRLSYFKLLPYLLPAFSVYFKYPVVVESLASLDSLIKDRIGRDEKTERSELFYYLIKPALIIECDSSMPIDEVLKDAFRQAKVLIAPITPANYELERAVLMVLSDYGIVPNRGRKNKANRAKKAPLTPKKKKDKKKKTVKNEDTSLAREHDK